MDTTPTDIRFTTLPTGWGRVGGRCSAYSLPANREDVVIQRILVRHGVSRDLGLLLLDDMKRCLQYFQDHPVTSPLTEEEAGGYHH